MKIYVWWITLFFIEKIVSEEYCKRDLMKAYFLKGLVMPNEQKIPYCPSIKKNCCTKSDIVDVFLKYKLILVHKLRDYRSKYNTALEHLEALQNEIVRIEDKQVWTNGQRDFCFNKNKKVLDFKIKDLIAKLRIGFDVASDIFLKIHESYLCVFCDLESQKSVMLETNIIAQDGFVCLDVLNKNRSFLISQNVDLVEYFELIQGYLDCTLFDGKYNFPFLFNHKKVFKEDLKTCLDVLNPSFLEKPCIKLCQHLRLGALSPEFEGDFFFLSDAVDYYSDIVQFVYNRFNNTAFDPIAALQRLNSDRDQIEMSNVPNKTEIRRRGMRRRPSFGVGETFPATGFEDASKAIENSMRQDDPLSGNLDMRDIPLWAQPQIYALARVPYTTRIIPPSLRAWVDIVARNKPQAQPTPLSNDDDRIERNIFTPYSNDPVIEDPIDPLNRNAIINRAVAALPPDNDRLLMDSKAEENNSIETSLDETKTRNEKQITNKLLLDSKDIIKANKLSDNKSQGNEIKESFSLSKNSLNQNGNEENKVSIRLLTEPPLVVTNTNDTKMKSSKTSHKKKRTSKKVLIDKTLSKKSANHSQVKAKLKEIDSIKPLPTKRKTILKSKKSNKSKRKTNDMKVEIKPQGSRRTKLLVKNIKAEPPVESLKKRVKEKKKTDELSLLKNPELLLNAYKQLKLKLQRSKKPKKRKMIQPKQNENEKFKEEEKKIVSEMNEVLKEKLEVFEQKHKKSKLRQAKNSKLSLKRTRILEELFQGDRFESNNNSIKPNRILQEDESENERDKRDRFANEIPSGMPLDRYYNELYESFSFFLNASSPEIFSKNVNAYDLVYFERIILNNMGLNTNIFEAEVNFVYDLQQIVQSLSSRTNLDPYDHELEVLIEVFDNKFHREIDSLIEKEFISMVYQEFLSKDDRDLITLVPTYLNIESFIQIDKSFFSDVYLSMDNKPSLPNPLVYPKTRSRYLMDKKNSISEVEDFKNLGTSFQYEIGSLDEKEAF